MTSRSFLPLLASVTLSAPLAAQATTIILVRHAEKSSPTGDAGLTAIGEQRVQDLVRAMANVRLAAVISTQFQRTRLTGEPVARSAHLQLTVVPAGPDMTASTAAIVRTLDSLPSGSTALVVGHSNTLAGIIAALGGPTLPDLCDGEHSTLFILERPGAGNPVSLVRARYGAAEPPEASQCWQGREGSDEAGRVTQVGLRPPPP